VSLPIRVRLTAWYTALLATTIVTLSVFLVLQLRADLVDATDEEMHHASMELTNAIVDPDDDADTEPNDTLDPASDFREAAQAILPPAAVTQLLDQQGRTVVQYGTVADVFPMVPADVRAAAMSGIPQTFTVSLGDQAQRYRVKVSSLQTLSQVRVLVLAESLQPVDDAVRRVATLLLIAGPALLGLTALAAYWVAGAALRPIERITTDAEEIGIDQLNERVEVPRSNDETRRLAVTLNAMLERIEQGILEKRRLLADASHELRTPLAIMRTEVDVALAADELSAAARDVLSSARDEVDRMTRMIENLLTSAQADEGRLELLTVPVDLRQLVDDAARALGPLADAKGVCLKPEGERWEVQADPPRMKLVLTNLVDNAIKFSPPGETVRIGTWRHDDEVGVTVSDAGPGISPSDEEHLFDRFFRIENLLGPDFGGSGLGLAICREVAMAHGGRIWVESPSGAGSAFSLALPSWRMLRSETSAEVTQDESA
jgi:heavy metal sensor kinase